jgi:hypothetical protein
MTAFGPHLDSFRHYSYLIAGQRTATVTILLCQAPWAGKVANPAANARVSGGTTPTLTVDLQVGATSKLAAAMTVNATPVWVAGTVATDPSVAESDDLEVVLTIGGTNPTWDDIVVEFDLVRS